MPRKGVSARFFLKGTDIRFRDKFRATVKEKMDFNNNNKKLYLHDHSSAYSIAKAILRIKITHRTITLL